MTNALIDALALDIHKLDTEMRTLLDGLEEKGEALEGASRDAFEAKGAAVAAKTAERRSLMEQAERDAALEASYRDYRDIRFEPGAGMRELREKFLAVVRQGAHVESDPMLRAGMHIGGRERALNVATPAGAGHLVPEQWAQNLYRSMVQLPSLMDRVNILQTSSGNKIHQPKTDARSAAVWLNESAAFTESNPTFDMVEFDAHKVGFYASATYELIEDEDFDLIGYLASQGTEQLRIAINAAIVAGDGTSKPHGITTRTTAGVTGAGAAPTADELIDLQHSVIQENRASAVWLVNDTTVADLRKIKDSDGQYIWRPGLEAGAPNLLLGNEVATDPAMPDTGTGNVSVEYGNPQKYTLRIAGGLRVERSDDVRFLNDETVWKFVARVDGDLVDTSGAVKHFVGG